MATCTGSSDSVERSREILRQLSHQSSDGGGSTAVFEEMELLRNVYFDELEISLGDCSEPQLKFHITPSTADDKDQQFVYLDVMVTLTATYPSSVPEISFLHSRGLSDAHLRDIAEGLHHKSTEHLGTPMIYELVEFAKDCLTDNNRPCGQCAVCQFEFGEMDEFTKTACYHYFHLPCLVSYIEFFGRQQRESEEERTTVDKLLRKKPKQLECPVCREPIPQDAACLEAIKGISPSSSEDELKRFKPSEEMRRWQTKMATLRRKQRERGGIIDPALSDDVIDETWVSRRNDNGVDSAVENLSTVSDKRGSKVITNRTEESNKSSYHRTTDAVREGRSGRGRRKQQDSSGPPIGGASATSLKMKTTNLASEQLLHKSSKGPPPGFNCLPVVLPPSLPSPQLFDETQSRGGTKTSGEREVGRREGGARRREGRSRVQQSTAERDSYKEQPKTRETVGEHQRGRYRPRPQHREYEGAGVMEESSCLPAERDSGIRHTGTPTGDSSEQSRKSDRPLSSSRGANPYHRRQRNGESWPKEGDDGYRGGRRREGGDMEHGGHSRYQHRPSGAARDARRRTGGGGKEQLHHGREGRRTPVGDQRKSQGTGAGGKTISIHGDNSQDGGGAVAVE